MSDTAISPPLAVDRLLDLIGIDRAATGGTITIDGADPVVPGRHRFGTAASAVLAAKAAAVAAVWKMRSGQGQDVRVDSPPEPFGASAPMWMP